MIAEFSKRVALFFAAKKIIPEKNIETYSYGFEILFSEVINSIIVLLIAVFTNNFAEALVFVVAFTVMRECAGGYHAKTHFRCIAIFTSVFVIFIIILGFLPSSLYTLTISIGLIINILLICKYAPADNPNKPFTLKEWSKYRQKSLVINLWLTVISTISLVTGLCVKLISLPIMLAILTVGFSVMFASIKNNH